MDITRAKQIISSPAEIEVTYHGQPVWLMETNDSNNMVTVKSMSPKEEQFDLPVDSLEEGESRR
ncbi:H-type small acid-soluble spore protein [Halalkalibacter urbisdiaboli]|uniref:H-type small acid-soluble spore protein n=1 Tax=Halalkalibacter urbisdiaboli TaxID=1960589 RepID=UPI000B450005|nr:H-type small acid-soluble spore protein [Halalkalibacter urbisdiaboli]